jgi:hypothetical protein
MLKGLASMKVTFSFTSSPDIRSLQREAIYTRNFEFPDAALELTDFREHVLAIADVVSRYTQVCLHLTCAELSLKNYPIKTELEGVSASGFTMNLWTIVLVFATATKRRRENQRKLHILRANPSIRLASDYYRRTFTNSLREGLIRDTRQWSQTEEERSNREYLVSVNDHILTLLNSDPSAEWRFVGFHPSYTDNSLIALMNTRGKRWEKEKKQKERDALKMAKAEEKAAEPSNPKGMYVYFVQAGESGPIKIGFSTDPDRRIKTLRTAMSEELIVLKVVKGSRQLEKTLHDQFSEINRRGEWYEPTTELLEFVSGLEASDASALRE